MSKKNALIAAAITGVISLSANSVMADSKPAAQEKCYGISKAGANDCASGVNGCAGSAKKDNQGDAWIYTPKGLCDRITGGSLKPINGDKK